MHPAAKSILEALDRFPHGRREDRLTEVFAHVLEAVPPLAEWLVGCVEGLPVPSGTPHPKAFTQGALAGSGRPDLRLEYRDRAGNGKVLLSEHKITADPTELQRGGYPGWKRDALILIAPDLARYRESAHFDRCLTWLDVADKVVKLGYDAAGERWRDIAREPQARVGLRCLHELLTLLEKEDVGVSNMQAIDETTVSAYYNMASTREVLETFLHLVRRDERFQDAGTSEVYAANARTHWWYEVPNLSWPYLLDLDPEACAHVALEASATWLDEPAGEPVLYAGFYFGTPQLSLPEQLRRRESTVSTALRQINATVGLQTNRKQGKCVKTLPLSVLAQRGDTLPRQAQEAASWTLEALQQMALIAP